MSNQIIITSGAKVRNLNGVLTGTAGVVDSVPLGGANGVATLDSSGKVPVSQLPASVVTYLGTWNAATNTPTLTNGVGDAGDMYLCNVAGTVDFGAGPISFNIGDWVLYGSGTWQKSNGQNGTVTSVDMTVPTGLAISGNPITTSGTLALSLASGYTIPTTSFLSGLVPYTGATNDLNLGSHDLYLASVFAQGTLLSNNGLRIEGDGVSEGGNLQFKQYASVTSGALGYTTLSANDSTSFNIYFNQPSSTNYKNVKLSSSLLTNNIIRTYSFPDLSGTLALLEGTQTFSGQKTFSTNPIITSLASANIEINSATGSTSSVGFKVNNSLVGFVSVNSSQFLFRNYVSNEFRFVDGLMTNGGILAMPSSSLQTYTFPASSGTLALTSNLSSYVPYTGATGSVDIGNNNYYGGTILLKQSAPSTSTTGYFSISGSTGTGTAGLVLGLGSGTTSSMAYPTSGNYSYVFPASSGTIALTSNIPTVSGASGQVTYFNGTSSVTGSNNFFWDATNNRLGIGLTNPQRALEVYSATADSHLRLSGSAPSVSMGEAITGSIYQAKFGLATANGQYASGAVAGDFVILSQTGATIFMTNATEKMRLNTSGRLLLGTNTDNGSLLQVAGSATFSSSVTTSDLVQTNKAGGLAYRAYYGSGNNRPLDINIDGGNGDAHLTWNTTYNAGWKYYLSNYAAKIASGNGLIFSVAASGTAGNTISWIDAMNITSSGNVGIGTSSPLFSGFAQLTINGTQGGIVIQGSSTGYSRLFFAKDDTSNVEGLIRYYHSDNSMQFFTSATERMRITSGGNMIHTSYSAGQGILWAYSGGATYGFYNAGNGTFVLTNSGVANVGYFNMATGVYVVTSDSNKKKDFEDSTIGLNAILGLKPTLYRMKIEDNSIEKHLGFIAQEVKDFIPQAYQNNGDFIGLDYQPIVAVLVKATQESHQIIKDLEARIVSLESK